MGAVLQKILAEQLTASWQQEFSGTEKVEKRF